MSTNEKYTAVEEAVNYLINNKAAVVDEIPAKIREKHLNGMQICFSLTRYGNANCRTAIGIGIVALFKNGIDVKITGRHDFPAIA